MVRFIGMIAVGCALALGAAAQAENWPQWMGPDRNGVSDEAISTAWPAAGPPVRWSAAVGVGYAGPAVVGDRLYLFHRVGDEDRLESRSADTGKAIWSDAAPARYVDRMGHNSGPRAVPTVAGGRVFAHGSDGFLRCVEASGGKRLWSVDTAERFGTEDGFFGRVCSPLVEGDRVILNVGGREGAGIVAFDVKDGTVVWKSTDHEAGYASPVAATIGGRRYVFVFTRAGVVALNPADGSVYFQKRYRARAHASVNAATPLVLGDKLFVSASYNVGAGLWQIGDGEPQVIWSADDVLSNQYATSVHRDGFLYGFDGRSATGFRLRCVGAATGKVCWTVDPFPEGSLILAGDHLLILTAAGELIAAPASPEGFKPAARASILGNETRAQPALAGGFYYARGPKKLIAIDLRPKPKP